MSQLRNVPMFSGCSAKELRLIANAAKEASHRAGTVIAREGEGGVGFFLIAEGEVEVTIGGKRIATLGPGEFFGEISLLDRGPRTATVTAKTPVRLIGLSAWTFRGLIKQHPTITLRMLETMAERLRSVTKGVAV